MPHDHKLFVYAWEEAKRFGGSFNEIIGRAEALYRRLSGATVH